jgi:hypothetical protein
VHPRQQPAVGKGGERGQRQHAVGAFAADAGGRLAEQVEAGREFGKIVATLLGEYEPARETLEQRCVEILLEPAHLLAHRRRGHTQLRRRRDEAAEAGRRFEGAQGI